MSIPSIVEFFTSKDYLGFDKLSPAQAALLRAVYGEEQDAEGCKWVKKCARGKRSTKEYNEVALVCGRRSGKSTLASGIACYEALLGGHEDYLSPGEPAVIAVISASLRQTSIIRRYIGAMLGRSPVLRDYIKNQTADSIELTNGVTIMTLPCSSRSIRGFAFPVVLADEIAYWSLEGYSDSDVDVMNAVRPAQGQFASPKLVMLSTPWIKKGVLWETFNRPRGALVWQARTVDMNPSIPRAFLRKERARDPIAYKREYEGQFTSAINCLFAAADIDRAMRRGYAELPPVPGMQYFGAIDPAFTRDSFTAFAAHCEGGRIIVDKAIEWKPSPSAPVDVNKVTGELAMLCRTYRIRRLWSDQYAAEPLKQVMRRGGVPLKTEVFSAQFKVQAYSSLRYLLAGGGIDLPDHEELRHQLKSVEEVRLPGGGVRIGAPQLRGEHDDLADALALLVQKVVPVSARRQPQRTRWVDYLRGGGPTYKSLGAKGPDYWAERAQMMPAYKRAQSADKDDTPQ